MNVSARFPRPLRPGDTIAVSAFSSGVELPLHARLDLVLGHLRRQGYDIVEGECLRSQHKDASAPRRHRAVELNRLLRDPGVAAIFPPWGGELASELLADIDFDALRGVPPKWLLGFSDVSTLLLPLTLVSGWATAHGPNLMDLAPTQTDRLTNGALSVLASDWAQPVRQHASALFQRRWTDFAVQPDAALNLEVPTRWRRLDGSPEPLAFSGRLIGGCLDTVAWLAGSRWGDVPGYAAAAPTILYLENAEQAPPALVRALLMLRRAGWFDSLAGLLLGRSAAPEPARADALTYDDALHAALDGLACPVVVDVDIGHQPPQFTLVNGAQATVRYAGGAGSVEQSRPSAGVG